MLFSAACVCLGQMLWKMSGGADYARLAGGFLLYGAGTAAMVAAYRFGNLSRLQPILSLNYPLSLAIAYFVFGETIGAYNLIAVALICAGVVLVASRGRRV
jgi:undecaprenyl phosphate-alpha-L-ara4N flippase subunit ArnE